LLLYKVVELNRQMGECPEKCVIKDID